MSVGRDLLAVGLGIAHLGLPASPLLANLQPADRCRVFAPEAGLRSGLPVDMILRVMRAESGGNPREFSSKGAIGCMQIMPATWAILSMRYSLGSNPFDARTNMIGGALYLAELRERFGMPGAYAAYNAGPTRYERFAKNGVALPAETVAYAARLGGAGTAIITANALARWQEAALFVSRSASTPTTISTDSTKVVGANDADAGNGLTTSNPASTVRLDPMFPLPAQNVEVRR